MNGVLYPWQHQVWQQLYQATCAKRLVHALVLSGPAQTGKMKFAEFLSAFWLCEQPNAQGSCGHCTSCLLYQAGNHPDFIHLSSEQGRIKVDQVRALTTRLQTSQHLSGYRVVLINLAENMNIAAANSLLKTLEEPPARTIILLVTVKLGRLLATVRSRCQHFSLQPSKAEVMAWLQQYDPQLSQADAKVRYQLLGHAPLQLVDKEYIDQYKQRIDTWLQVLEGKAVRYGVKPVQLIDQLAGWARLCHWLMKASLGVPLNVETQLTQRLVRLARRMNTQTLSVFYNELQASIKLLGEHNSLNETLLFDGHWASWRGLVAK